ncbi:hypothetical protein AB0368_10445 [Actinoplanes sp. NPDC051475]|uniref:hypothetical protein n=1 Tax=Actinoplanes sp. NPDC051475 TaxID=3157225 RepID=UPI00344CC8DB
MTEHDEALREAVQQVAWTWARAGSSTDADSPHDVGLSGDQRREAWLAVLAGLTAVQREAAHLAEVAATRAVEYGADYPALGRAAGVTRQGARRRWPQLPVSRSLSRRRSRSMTDDMLTEKPIKDPLSVPNLWP